MHHHPEPGRHEQRHREPLVAGQPEADERQAEQDHRGQDDPAEAADAAARGQEQRAGQGAHAERRHEQAEGVRAAVEDVGGEDRHEHGEGHAHHADDADEEQQRADRREAEGVAQAVPQLAQHGPSLAASRRPRLDPHRGEGGDDRDVAEAVQQEHDSLADEGDHEPGHRRARQPRGVEDRRVEGDRVGQIVAPPHHLDEERLARGDVDAVDEAEEHAEDEDVGDGGPAREHEGRQHQRLDHGQDLGADHDAAAVGAVGPYAGQRREKQARELAREAHQTEEERRAGHAIDEPAERHLLHPRTGQRDHLATQEQAEIPVAEGADGLAHALSAVGITVHLDILARAPLDRDRNPSKLVGLPCLRVARKGRL